MADLWRSESHCDNTWSPKRIFKVLLLPLFVGQSSGLGILRQKRVAYMRSIYARKIQRESHAVSRCTKVLLPPLHIKLGLMKTFVKNLDRNGAAFQYLAQKFPEI